MERFGNPNNGEQYRQALASTRAAKNVFWWLIFVALAVQLAGLVLIRFVKVVDESGKMRRLMAAARPAVAEPAPPAEPAPTPTTQPDQAAPTPQTGPAGPVATSTVVNADAAAIPEEAPQVVFYGTSKALRAEPVDAAAEAWLATLNWAMPAAKFAALAAGMLLVLTLLLAVKLALLGRMPGVAALVSAFFWSLLLWMLLIPWQQTLAGSTFACGALSNCTDLMEAGAKLAGAKANWFTCTVYYARFAAYPLLAVVLWLLVQAKFARGYRQAMGMESPEADSGESQGKI